jgi:hypothetical protein
MYLSSGKIHCTRSVEVLFMAVMNSIFQVANVIALVGWLLLVFAPRRPWSMTVAGTAIPLGLSMTYTALLVHSIAGGGFDPSSFDSLEHLAALFQSHEVLCMGWVHYLAFDLVVGAWIVRHAPAHGVPHLVVVLCLALTLMFGPVGFLSFHIIRLAITRARPRQRT